MRNLIPYGKGRRDWKKLPQNHSEAKRDNTILCNIVALKKAFESFVLCLKVKKLLGFACVKCSPLQLNNI